jgi:hypothetical protein
MKVFKSKKIKRDTKRIFFKLGSCSRTFFYLLNREFGFPLENEERAADPFAGGILQQGYQCGMLWGASLALGAESFRRTGDVGKAVAMTLKATQHIMKSFINMAKSADCLDITSCDFSKKSSIAKFFFSGKFYSCYKLAEKWAPEAFQSAAQGLALEQTHLARQPINCASEVAGKMGASDAEIVMVAGFAGGLGLSGNGCGALCAAIWMNTLARVRKQPGKSAFSNPYAEKILKAFYETTDYEMLCNEISGQSFKSIDDHTEFIKNGGCDKLIDVLADNNSLQ